MQEKIIILDFGSQTTQLIGRRVRELNTYCEILPYNKFPHDDPSVIGVILSGSPFSVYDEKAFKVDLSKIRGKYPILGICYGAQFIAYSNGGKLKSEVNDAFCDLVEAMWAETGLHLVNASPYRSYQTQKNLYARYRTQYSEATTDRFSARAGYSEHQTGLALDVIAPGGTLNGFKNTQQFVWMRDNAHRFGFILRYGDGMEYITGYKFEPWHYRYVGVEAATFIYENDLTFEEYYAYYVKK